MHTKNVPVVHNFQCIFQHPLHFACHLFSRVVAAPRLPLLRRCRCASALHSTFLTVIVHTRNDGRAQTHRVTCVALRATNNERWLISHHTNTLAKLHTMNTIINYLTCARSQCCCCRRRCCCRFFFLLFFFSFSPSLHCLFFFFRYAFLFCVVFNNFCTGPSPSPFTHLLTHSVAHGNRAMTWGERKKARSTHETNKKCMWELV